ncbi:MAG TPA: radical SAM family heme chaperone HemW [Puia sp.]|nr:radical SAM family heme chaperone HemW [Puia sp.]
MAGIYIHIPFCKQACYYCNFHFSTSLKNKNDFVSALLKEIKLRQRYLQDESIETIYFGGGTPSLLTKSEIQMILDQLRTEFSVMAGAEITLEANPDDVLPSTVKIWKDAGINRLSLGVQSFFEEDLHWMNRAHNAAQASDAIRIIRGGGFDNLSIDLIYGSPTLSDVHWKKNVELALQFHIPHLSCYALTVEAKTALQKMIATKKSADIVPEDQARQFLSLIDWMKDAGYEHYEISNFALPGWRSRHNTSYWQGKKYLGLGPSAHSFDGLSRQWNVSNNIKYIDTIAKNELPFEKEILTNTQRLNEYIMTSLRTMEGLDLFWVEKEFGVAARQKIEKESRQYVEKSQLENKNENLILTKEGKLFADGIAASLFFGEEELALYFPG